MTKKIIRQILPSVKDFKVFWKKKGPFKYALTSAEFPPVLLEPEEWIFSDNVILLLKELMQWDLRKMEIVNAPFNKNKRNILKPETLIPWRIEHFPQEWESSVCDTFTPVGYLTEALFTESALQDKIRDDPETSEADHATGAIQNSLKGVAEDTGKGVEEDTGKVECSIPAIENAFFQSLEANINKIGYILLKPEPLLEKVEEAYVDEYLQEWQADEDEG